MPMPGGEWPGTGAILAAVETASGRVAEIAGKPERHLFEMALARPLIVRESGAGGDGRRPGLLRHRGGAARGAGDGPGAQRHHRPRATAEAADPPPDHVVDDLAGLLR